MSDRRWIAAREEAEKRRWSLRAFKDFCKSHGIVLVGTRKNPQVRPQDVDDALDHLAKLRTESDQIARDIEASPPPPRRAAR